MVSHLSDGTFGRVFEVKNIENNNTYALKMIRAVERYVDSAKTETEILEYILKKDPISKFHNVELVQTFNFGSNYCMVFERLGLSLYELMKKNNYRGFPIKMI